ncbi:MAG: LolA-related protein [Halopseudomonas sabulinigri]|tara:strand:+ start:2089 stop:2634 length:546 start_codon:yes stop_codon:yes gene_type:complete
MHRLLLLFSMLFSFPVLAALDSATLGAQLAESSPQCSHFAQTRWLADLEAELESDGYFQRTEEGLVWHTLTPIDSRLVLSADNPDMPLAYQAILPVLNGLLGGDWAALQQHFSLDLSGELNAWQAELAPTDKLVAERLKQLQVSGGEQVEQLQIDFVSGDRMTLQLSPTDCAALPGDSNTP